ncbi:von Willebrand factor A-like protein [Gracilaria domingensis]|nr:von Willebrand factor A-like protein [Gracilaria domingensis]
MATRLRGRMLVDVDKDDDDTKQIGEGYAWESSKVRSWEQIEEDPETGRLKSYQIEHQRAKKKIRDDGPSGVRRGIIRFCVVIIDMSQSLRSTDLKPSRADLVVDSLQSFIKEFFDQNPISQLSVVMTRDGKALRLSPFSSNEKHHVEALQKASRLGPGGNPSLQNSLTVAVNNLASVPPYGMKEILVSYGSLSTCDPGDIHQTIDSLVSEKIRCSAIGLGAELHILRCLTKNTGGTYVIARNEEHFRDSWAGHIIPPPTTNRQVSASLIRMGFPMLERLEQPALYCNNPNLKGRFGYHCPRCSAWISEMPSECALCGLTLVSSPHLARSYHHLFPVPRFVSLDDWEPHSLGSNGATNDANSEHVTELLNTDTARCIGCKTVLRKDKALRLLCPNCLNIFCIDCDSFIHDSLHHCPGCGNQTVRNL